MEPTLEKHPHLGPQTTLVILLDWGRGARTPAPIDWELATSFFVCDITPISEGPLPPVKGFEFQ